MQFGSRGTYVYMIDAEDKATIRDVTLGPAEGEEQSIVKGLAAGERVILEGLDRLREGRPVSVVRDDGSVEPPSAGAAQKSGSGEGRKGKKKQT